MTSSGTVISCFSMSNSFPKNGVCESRQFKGRGWAPIS